MREPKICSRCGQIIPPRLEFKKSPVKQRIYEFVSKRPDGVGVGEIMDFVYRQDPDGGPDAMNTIAVHISKMNKELRKKGIEIRASRGRGAVYTLRAFA